MTGREFFSRFPELHSFLLSQLQAACHGIDRLLLSVLCMILFLLLLFFFLHFTSPKSSTRKKQKQEKQFRDTWLAILIVMFFSQKGGFTLVLFHVTGCVSADYSLIVRHFSFVKVYANL